MLFDKSCFYINPNIDIHQSKILEKYYISQKQLLFGIGYSHKNLFTINRRIQKKNN